MHVLHNTTVLDGGSAQGAAQAILFFTRALRSHNASASEGAVGKRSEGEASVPRPPCEHRGLFVEVHEVDGLPGGGPFGKRLRSGSMPIGIATN